MLECYDFSLHCIFHLIKFRIVFKVAEIPGKKQTNRQRYKQNPRTPGSKDRLLFLTKLSLTFLKSL